MDGIIAIPSLLVHALPEGRQILYHRYEELGHGGFAKVFRGTCDSDHEVAIKVTSKERLLKPKAQQKHRAEVEIQQSLNHPNILKPVDFFGDDHFTYLVLELCSNGSLKAQLRKRLRFTEEDTIRYLRDVLTGTAHLHDNRVLHRDLKLENFLMDDRGTVKIGDFGLSAKLDHDDERRFTVCGTPNYMCPEMISGSRGVSYEWTYGRWGLGRSEC
jgi:polo-like kinase 1